MEPKKYWWLAYVTDHYNGCEHKEQVTEVHPFHLKLKLISWKLISVEEWLLWKELNNK